MAEKDFGKFIWLVAFDHVFIWLVAFDHVEIDSTFSEPDADGLLQRKSVLNKYKPLLPLFEAVINAFQANQDAATVEGKLVIEIERGRGLGLDDTPPITAFKITDSGIGLNDTNFNSFNTAFSELKISRGGKGLGKFIWLVAFDHVEIDSTFSEPDADGLLQRKFTFDTDYDPDKALPTPADRKSPGTIVRLVGFKEPYCTTCPQSAEQIAQRLIEHFLLMFLQSNAPKVELHDRGKRLLLNQLFETDFKASAAAHKFELSGAPFTIHGFRLITPRASRHRLVYAGNSRGVQSDNLGDYIPNLSGRLPDGDGNSFVYLAVVQSRYLDQRVNNARTAFDIPLAEADDDQLTLLPDKIRLSDIRDASCAVH